MNITTEQRAAIEFERLVAIIIPTIFALVIIIGLIGNALVLTVVAVNRQMRNSTNTLVLNLSVCDLVFLTVCIPFTAIQYASTNFPFAEWWCATIKYLQMASAYGSVWTLVLLALDRNLAVVYPVKGLKLRTPKITMIILAVMWTFILIACTPLFAIHKIVEYPYLDQNRTSCVYKALAYRQITKHVAWAYYFSFNIFGYALPLGISCVLYSIMLKRLWSLPHPGNNSRTSIRKNDRVRAKKRITYMSTGVMGTFAVFWLPINICFGMNALAYPRPVDSENFLTFQIFAQVFAYANACVNPILYSFLSTNYRKGFWKVLTAFCILCHCKKQSRPEFVVSVKRRRSNGQEEFRIEVQDFDGPIGPKQSIGAAAMMVNMPSMLRPALRTPEHEFESSPAILHDGYSLAKEAKRRTSMRNGQSLRELFALSHVEVSHSIYEPPDPNNENSEKST